MARNSKFNSAVGIKEHMVAYLASGKSRHTSQVFSKQGGKGTRPLLEIILKNSESIYNFLAPENCSLFFTFDNIQTLLNSHRIGGEHQKKILAIVVCSILCLLPDGEGKKSEVQYTYENCPANWLFHYQYQPESKVFNKNINATIMKECLTIDTEESNIFEQIFENDLEKAINFVQNDMNENLQDSVDIKTKAVIAKKRKLCSNGHINDNVRTNRKVCDREFCKAKLEMDRRLENICIETDTEEAKVDKPTQKATTYLNVPNIIVEDIPKELAVGEIAVNPNTPERIARVLD